jgi:hypothetical protein
MPGRNGTGPMGMGSRTGSEMGPCGRGMRRGFGRRFWYTQPSILPKKEEKQMLEEELKILKEDIETVQKRIKELK